MKTIIIASILLAACTTTPHQPPHACTRDTTEDLKCGERGPAYRCEGDDESGSDSVPGCELLGNITVDGEADSEWCCAETPVSDCEPVGSDWLTNQCNLNLAVGKLGGTGYQCNGQVPGSAFGATVPNEPDCKLYANDQDGTSYWCCEGDQ